MTLNLPKEYGYVVLASAGILLQCMGSAYSVMKLRKQFNVPYPDTGSGRYADKLSEFQWLQFNNAQRVHHNYVEQHSSVQTLLWLAAIFNPIGASISGLGYILGRAIYSHVYLTYGAEKRIVGVVPINLSLVAMLIFTVKGSLHLLEFI
ncbi:hypothetical protein CONCODRAFT_67495 [Conidiobolus coronatus NRRL 28638]|uniref:Membrane-associated proteins in eicosanoid and glutathione metabolism n=1 Tax=Conidiobolus coronatus (strain ATCC 28846 / CBS 209.66 / NRRL 28638) TaxID=796925 RepID=A0A137PHH0_CONC2|nr:hypothetical protein CONCODRAFT_67495 [Conidiobolus coronatus NRRL 28638]|eukprot:KXN74456.1 hypothetical protein CONCODRAFT_67495 [Conidiobolus coronatus NRRL 28638]